MACQVALVMPLESWSAPRIIVFWSCRCSVLTLTNPETAATMMTINVIETISFRPRRLGITDNQILIYVTTYETAEKPRKAVIPGGNSVTGNGTPPRRGTSVPWTELRRMSLDTSAVLH